MRKKTYEGMSLTRSGKINSGLLEDVKDRKGVNFEDIIDTGYTMTGIIDQLKKQGAAEVYVSTLLFKPEALKVEDLQIDYVALEIPNAFIVGYGLDYDELGRNLKDIYVVAE